MNVFSVVEATRVSGGFAEVCGRCVSGRITTGSVAIHSRSSEKYIVSKIMMYEKCVPDIYESDTAKLQLRPIVPGSQLSTAFCFDDRLTTDEED